MSEIESLDDLTAHPNNPNKGTKKGQEFVSKSLTDYGAGRSILADKNGVIIAGNQTTAAAKKLGRKKVRVVQTTGDEIVVVQRMDLDASDPIAKGLAVADNRASELGLEWDPLALDKLDIKLDALFSEKDLRRIGMTPDPVTAPDAQVDRAEEFREKWQTERGQIWEVGDHRIMCGDATIPEDVQILMQGTKSAMLFTDPPWNVAIGGDGNPRHRQREGLQNDSMSQTDFVSFLQASARTIADVTRGDVYCVMGCEQWPTIDAALRAVDLHWSATIIWVKDLFVLGRSKYHRRYEPIWYGWPDVGNSSFDGGRDLDDVWEIARPRTSDEHPTMKPIELVARAIRNSSGPGNIVCDPFVGSGTTMAAAQALGRICYGMDIEPKYVAVVLERLSELGLTPRLLPAQVTA